MKYKIIKLDTPNGECDAELRIVYHTENACTQGNAPIISVGITYGNQEFRGYSKSSTPEIAYANLQKSLPAGVFLKCCLTCRHGNMCPYSNDDAVYCTKDYTVTSKEDVCNLIDRIVKQDFGELDARQRDYGDFCESYLPQDDAHYTYNDYSYYITAHK